MTYNTSRRRHFTPKQRAAFLEKHDYICYWCGERIETDQPWDIEHRIARELLPDASADNDDNLAPIHALPKRCHKIKTAIDRQLIAKSNRIRRKHGLDPDKRKHKPKPIRSQGFRRGGPKQKIPSRKFPKKEK